MKISEIMEEIRKKTNVLTIEEWILEEDIEEVIYDQEGAERENALYFQKASEEMSLTKAAVFFFVLEEQREMLRPVFKKMKKEGRSYCVFPLSLYKEIYEVVKELMWMELKSDRFILEVVADVLKGENLDVVLGKMEKRLKNPLIVIDAGFKIIGWSKGIEVTDPIWSVNIGRGYCSYEFIKEVHKIEALSPFPNSSEPFEVVCTASPNRKICTKIYDKGILVAYVILLDLHGTDAGYRRILKQSAGVLCEVLKKSEHHGQLFASQKESLFLDLLRGENGEHMDHRLNMHSLHFTKPKLLLSVLPAKHLLDLSAEGHLREKLKEIFPMAFICEEEGLLYILCEEEEGGKLCEKTEKKLSDLTLKGVENIIISRKIQKSEEVRVAFHEISRVREAAEMIGENKYLYYFQEYMIYVLLLEIEKGTWNRFVHPALDILKNFDGHTQGELYKTLETYLSCESQMLLTAEKLSIHRNSLSYRLNRIIELTGISLDSEVERFSLRISFRIDQLATGIESKHKVLSYT